MRFAGKVIDFAVLGMGNDGHTASLFPGGDMLEAAMADENDDRIFAMQAEGAGEPRLTFSAKALKAAKHLAMHIEGADKLATLDAALDGKDEMDMPIRTFLHDPEVQMTIYWAPKK